MNQKRIDLLKAFIEEEPNNPFNRYALAMELYEEAPSEAQILLEFLQANHADYLPLYYKLAHLYWESEDWDKAEKTFLSGIELARRQSEAKTLSELQNAYQNFEFERE